MKKLLRYHFTLKGIATLAVNANHVHDAHSAAKAVEKAVGVDLFDHYEMIGIIGDFDALPADKVRPELTAVGQEKITAQIAVLQQILITNA